MEDENNKYFQSKIDNFDLNMIKYSFVQNPRTKKYEYVVNTHELLEYFGNMISTNNKPANKDVSTKLIGNEIFDYTMLSNIISYKLIKKSMSRPEPFNNLTINTEYTTARPNKILDPSISDITLEQKVEHLEVKQETPKITNTGKFLENLEGVARPNKEGGENTNDSSPGNDLSTNDAKIDKILEDLALVRRMCTKILSQNNYEFIDSSFISKA